jgi:hypothetical protein
VAPWGDYGAATVDAATGLFYLGNEYIPDPAVFPRIVNGNWGTFITRVAVGRGAHRAATVDKPLAFLRRGFVC